GGAAVHILGSGERFPQYGSLCGGHSPAPLSQDRHNDRRGGRNLRRRPGTAPAWPHHKTHPELVLEPVRRNVCVPRRRTGEHGNRDRERLATRWISYAVPQCVSGGLGYWTAERTFLGVETSA